MCDVANHVDAHTADAASQCISRLEDTLILEALTLLTLPSDSACRTSTILSGKTRKSRGMAPLYAYVYVCVQCVVWCACVCVFVCVCVCVRACASFIPDILKSIKGAHSTVSTVKLRLNLCMCAHAMMEGNQVLTGQCCGSGHHRTLPTACLQCQCAGPQRDSHQVTCVSADG